MKKERFSTIVVTILVGISILLTYISMFQLRQTSVLQENNKSHEAYRFTEKRDFIMPIMTVIDSPESQGIKSSRQQYVIDSVIDQVQALEVTVTPTTQVLEKQPYIELLKKPGVQLIFPVSVTVDMVDYFFNQVVDGVKKVPLNRVVVSFETSKLYLMDDETYTVLAVDIPIDVFKRNVQSVYARQINDFQSSVAVTMERGIDYIPATSWDEVSRQYVLERINPLTYTKHIFGIGDVVQNESTSEKYHYTTDSIDFSIDKKTGFLNLETIASATSVEGSRWLIDQMNAVENWRSSSILFEKQDQNYTFRRYIGKYPIFSEKDTFDETVVQYLSDAQVIKAQAATDVLQTSILSREKTVRVSGYQELSEFLAKHKKSFEAFQYIDMAYTIEWSSDRHILTAVPEWYVYYQNKWLPLRVIVSEETL